MIGFQHHNKWLLFYTLVGFYRLADFFAKTSFAHLWMELSAAYYCGTFGYWNRESQIPHLYVWFLSFLLIVSDLFPENLRTNGSITCSIVSLSFAVTMKSSAYRTRCILGTSFVVHLIFLDTLFQQILQSSSAPRVGDIMPPCGVPSSVGRVLHWTHIRIRAICVVSPYP